jgi:prevent-host-death family protein
MEISVAKAKARLTELVRRAEAGEEVILTRRGQAAVRLVALNLAPDLQKRTELLEAILAAGASKANDGPCAARSQDFLYGEDGVPV